jgi:hypothetical protein
MSLDVPGHQFSGPADPEPEPEEHSPEEDREERYQETRNTERGDGKPEANERLRDSDHVAVPEVINNDDDRRQRQVKDISCQPEQKKNDRFFYQDLAIVADDEISDKYTGTRQEKNPRYLDPDHVATTESVQDHYFSGNHQLPVPCCSKLEPNAPESFPVITWQVAVAEVSTEDHHKLPLASPCSRQEQKQVDADESGEEMILGLTEDHEKELKRQCHEVLGNININPNGIVQKEEQCLEVQSFAEEHIGLEEEQDLKNVFKREEMAIVEEEVKHGLQFAEYQEERIGLDEEDDERLREIDDLKPAYGGSEAEAAAILGREVSEPELILPCQTGKVCVPLCSQKSWYHIAVLISLSESEHKVADSYHTVPRQYPLQYTSPDLAFPKSLRSGSGSGSQVLDILLQKNTLYMRKRLEIE